MAFRGTWAAGIAIAMAVAATGPGTPPARADEAGATPWTEPTPRVARVVVRAARGPLALDAVVADTEAGRTRGLAGHSLGEGEAVLYDFEGRGPVRMWTRDDKVALDMAFVSADGIVAYLRRDVQPGTEEPVAAGVPVRWVVEMAAGTIEAAGLAVGDGVDLAGPAADPGDGAGGEVAPSPPEGHQGGASPER